MRLLREHRKEATTLASNHGRGRKRGATIR